MSPSNTARPRIAYVSPFPPEESGIADYSAELVPRLADHVELELFAGEPGRVGAELAGSFPVHAQRRLPDRLADGRFDAVLYHLGNNPDYHAEIHRLLLEHPGIVVLHEYVLHHLVRELTLQAGDPDGYVDALRYSYGRTGELMGRRSVATGLPLDPFRYPLLERAVDRSRGLIVHNRATAERVLASRPDARVTLVPSHLSLHGLDEVSVEAARRELGIPPDAFVVATFGFLTAAKRVPMLLRAFARLRYWRPEARLLLVGEVSPHYRDFQRAFTPEVRSGVEITGRLPLDRFLLHMAACDVAVNLRFPTAGETSATLIRLLGLGKPVLVSRAGAFAEVPDGCCVQVDVDDTEEEQVLANLALLAEDEGLRRDLGANARRHARAHHSLAGSAAAYADVLRRSIAERWEPAPSPPPLAAFPRHDLTSHLVRDVAADLADLGAGERDEIAAEVARAVVGLGLDAGAAEGAR